MSKIKANNKEAKGSRKSVGCEKKVDDEYVRPKDQNAGSRASERAEKLSEERRKLKKKGIIHERCQGRGGGASMGSKGGVRTKTGTGVMMTVRGKRLELGED